MGKSKTVRYVVSVTADRGVWTNAEWRSKVRGTLPGFGRPTAENLRNYCVALERSTSAGGVNAHLGATQILSARVVDTATDDILATYVK